MDVCILDFGQEIYWKFSPTGPLLYDLPSSPGVQLISPLVFGQLGQPGDDNQVTDRTYPIPAQQHLHQMDRRLL